MKLTDYLTTLESGSSGKPDQVKDGIEIYVSLWRKAVERGVVTEDDEIGDAVEKVERAGGLYKAAEG